MAEGAADGVIIIDTEIRTDQFADGTKDMKRSLVTLRQCAEDFQKRFPLLKDSAVQSLAKIEEKIQDTKRQIEEASGSLKEYNRTMDMLKNARDRSMQSAKSEEERIAAEKKYQEQVEIVNSAYRTQIETIEKLKRKYEDLSYERDRKINEAKEDQSAQAQKILDNESSNDSGGSSDSSDLLKAAAGIPLLGKFASSASKIKTMLGSLKTVIGSVSATALAAAAAILAVIGLIALKIMFLIFKFKTIRKMLIGLGSTIVKAFVAIVPKVASAIKTIYTHFSLLARISKTVSSAISKLGDAFHTVTKRIVSTGLRRIINALFSEIKSGIESMAQYSQTFNRTMSALSSGWTQLRNSMVSVLAPILNAVTPMLLQLISLLTKAANAAGMFVAALTGQKTFIKAKGVQTDYAKSLDKTKESADDAKRSLAGFDNLNILDSNKGKSSSSSGSDDLLPSDMFKTVGIDKSISDFVKRLKKAIKKGDFEGAGRMLADKLNSIVIKVDDWINQKFRPNAVKWSSNIARILNGLTDRFDARKLGKTVADGLNAVFDTINTFLTTYNFGKLGQKVADGINGLFSSVDWTLLGETFANHWNALIKFLYGIVIKTEWKTIGQKIAEFVNSWFQTIEWDALGKLLHDGIVGIIDSVIAFIDGLSSEDIANAIADFIDNIDLADILFSLFNLVSAIFDKLPGIIQDVIGKFDWEEEGHKIGKAIASLFDKKKMNWAEFGKTVGKLVEDILELLVGVFSEIDPQDVCDSISSFLSNALDEIDFDQFSTLGSVLWEIGKSIVEGILKGIAKKAAEVAWDKALGFFGSYFKKIYGISSPSKVFEGYGKYLIEGLKKGYFGEWGGTSTMMKQNAASLHTSITNALSQLKSSTQGIFNSVKNIMSTSMTKARNHLAGMNFDNVGSHIITGIWSGIKNKRDWLINGIQNVGGWITEAFYKIFRIGSPSKLMRDEVGVNLGLGIGVGIDKSKSSVMQSVSNLARTISQGFDASEYTIKGVSLENEIDGSISNFSDKIVNGFSAMLDRLQAIADSVTFSVPAVTYGAVPYKLRVADSSVSGEPYSLSDLSGAIKGAVRDVLQEQNGTRSNSPMEIYITLDGKVIGRSAVEYHNGVVARTGVTPLKGV